MAFHTLKSGEGNGNPLQDSFLENPTDRGAWRAAVPGAAQSDTTEPLNHHHRTLKRASQVALVQDPPASAGDTGDAGSIPGSGRSPGGGHDNPPQCSCLENPMDKGDWWAAIHGITKSWT